MNKILISGAFILFTCYSQAQKTEKDFRPLLRLEGTWTMQTKKGVLFEIWKKKDNTRMESNSYRVSGTDTLHLESVQLLLENGSVFYRPTVPDQNEGKQVSFTLSKIDGSDFHFINPEHDFPKRIIYSLKNETELNVRIDDNTDGSTKRSDYSFKRQQ